MRGHRDVHEASALMRQNDEHEQQTIRDGGNDEEVGRHARTVCQLSLRALAGEDAGPDARAISRGILRGREGEQADATLLRNIPMFSSLAGAELSRGDGPAAKNGPAAEQG